MNTHEAVLQPVL